MPRPVRWCFLLVMLALPYEYADLGIMAGADIVKASSALLVLLYLFYKCVSRQRSYSFPGLPLWCFLTYVAIFAADAFSDPLPDGLAIAVTLVQLLVFFWISADLLKSPTIARQALLTYATATFVLASATLANVPGFATVIDGRVAAVGDNPNTQAQHMVLSLLILGGLTITGTVKQITRRLLVLGMVFVLLAGLALTGSRSAIIGLVLACFVYLFPQHHSKRIFVSAAMAIVMVVAGIYMISRNADFSDRLRDTYYEGESAGRDEIYETAIDMIMEKPLLGWHPVTGFYELGTRLGITTGKDVHNLVLDLLLGLGVVGAIPFLLGILLCMHMAWTSRGGALGMLPLALITANLAASMFHTNVEWKAQWLVFALAVSARPTLEAQRKISSGQPLNASF